MVYMHGRDEPHTMVVDGHPVIIQPRAEKDRFDNDVSIVELPHRSFRLVHFTPVGKFKQRAVLYSGPGRFIRLYFKYSDNPCAMIVFEAGGYQICWGDGDNLSVEHLPDHATTKIDDLMTRLRQVHSDNWEECLVCILLRIEHDDSCWRFKELTRQ